jgi:hypothetical protein
MLLRIVCNVIPRGIMLPGGVVGHASHFICIFSYGVIKVSSRVSVTFRLEKADRGLLEKICRARGESLSSFVRRALRREFARLGYLSQDEAKALGFSTEKEVEKSNAV